MADNKAFWEWVKETYPGYDLPLMLPWEIPKDWKTHYKYWETYVQLPKVKEAQGLSPGEYQAQAYMYLERAAERGEINYEQYKQAEAQIQKVLDSMGYFKTVETFKGSGVLQDVDKEGKVITETVPTTAPLYIEASLLEPDLFYQIEKKNRKDYQAAYEQQLAQLDKQQVNYKLRRVTGYEDNDATKPIQESVEDWMNRVQQFEAKTEGDIALAEAETEKGAGQSEMSKKLETEAARARLQPQLAAQRRSGMDATGGQLTDRIRQARAMGIDTSEAEASLGQYEGNEASQLSADYKLNRQMNDVIQGEQWTKGSALMSAYPEQLTRWKSEEQQRRLNLGAATGGMEGAPLDIDPGGFFRWSENNPEFQKAVTAKETQMLTDFPDAYPMYQNYVSGISLEDLRGGTTIKPFEEWQKTSPITILSQRKKEKESGAWKSLSRRARQTARI